jgi:hypothetical protein
MHLLSITLGYISIPKHASIQTHSHTSTSSRHDFRSHISFRFMITFVFCFVVGEVHRWGTYVPNVRARTWLPTHAWTLRFYPDYMPFAQQTFLKITLFWECLDPQAFTLNYLTFVQQIFFK